MTVVGLALTPRTASKQILDALHNAVTALPGATEAAIRRRTGLPRSSVRHHLRSLVELGVLQAKHVRREKHYFAGGLAEQALEREGALAHGRAHMVLREILLDPGLAQQELCERVGMTRKILGGYLDILAEGGVIVTVRDGRFQRYFAGPNIEPEMSSRLLEGAPLGSTLEVPVFGPEPPLGLPEFRSRLL